MKKILIIYYTQTGQLKDIVDSITGPLKNDYQLFFEELKPVPAYPFPWNGMSFFQVFPESVKEIACELEPFQNDPDIDYDLIILAYQVWYLSPSIPITSFLQSTSAKKILKDKPVITVLGVRNMWIMAQERVKSMIADAGGRIMGNIAMADPASNLTSVITIVRWMMKGEKSPFRWLGMKFPPAGVPEVQIKNARVFGDSISKSLPSGNFQNLQYELVAGGAVKVDPVLMNIEKRGKMMFGIWAKMILKKGAYNDPAREGRLKLFKYYLFLVIYLVSPLVSAIFWLIFKINPRAASRIIKRYSYEMESL
jgi:hypothetical protein